MGGIPPSFIVSLPAKADDPVSSASSMKSRVQDIRACAQDRRGKPLKAAQLFDLSGRVALVTGASSGLGVRFAEALAANGAAVVLVARRVERLDALRERIETGGARALAFAADVSDRAGMRAAFDAAEGAFGTVDILVNNAGVA